MVIVAFKPGEKEISKYEELDQYDYGQILRIQGLNLPPAVEIHFALQKTGGTSKNRIGITKDGVTDVPIPDSMLENGDTEDDYSIYAFIYITDETSGQTEYRITLRVKARPKPEVPGGGDNPDIFHGVMETVREAMEAAAESERQAEGWAHGREDLPERTQDNAKYYSDQAREDSMKTDADRKEVGRLVESVSGIGEQVEKVESLTKQAQTSATNAALSEQAAKESENNAAQARAGAEVAEDNAELAAQRAEQDKAIVEQAKNLVKQMGQEVLDNKNLVDKTAQDFDLNAQQALADVSNAGQTQTERVQTAGNDAVESVRAAQGTATRAVETAKTEAIEAVQTEGATQAGNVSAEGEKQVQAVRGAAQEIVEDRGQIQENKTGIAKLKEDLKGKLDKNQGAENAGKVLVVGEDGNVVLKEVQGGGSQGKPETWSEIAEIVKSGKAQEVFKIGDQFVDKWTDKATGQEYDWTWDVVHFGNVTLENGETVPGMYLQAHYLTPFAIQFDHEENEKATEPTFSGDYSYYTKNPDGSFKLEEVVVGQQIPSETQYFHSAIKDPTGNICRYGYNRWSHSAYRQWLNSDSAEKGKWWTAQHLGDVVPNEHNSRAGFLSGFEQDFLSVIKKVKIRTQLNTITDKDVGTDEETVDLMFLPSKEQLYGTLEGSIYNDEAFEYYKQVAGFEAPNNGNSTGRIKYKLDAQTSADWQRLRSPIRWSSYNTWICGAAGNLSYYNAISAGRCAPACVIA